MTEALNDGHTFWGFSGALREYGMSAMWQPGFGGGIIFDVIPGGPADRIGIRAGDGVSSINGVGPSGFNRGMPRVASGGSVPLVVDTLGTNYRTVRITPDPLATPPFAVQTLANGIVHVRLRAFYEPEPFVDYLERAMAEAARSNPRGWILDLRSNSGGSLESMVEIAAVFGYQGTVATEVRRGGESRAIVAPVHTPFVKGPLAILVNYNTQSAAEVLALVLQDSGTARVLGYQTSGVVGVGKALSLTGSLVLNVTTSRLEVGPHAASLEGRGVMPDTYVTLDRQPLYQGVDSQIEAAIAYIKSHAP
jgi:carboxyl-terminal processing protease